MNAYDIILILVSIAGSLSFGWMLSNIIGSVPARPETAKPPRLRDDPDWDRFYAAVSKKNGTKIDGEVFWLFKDKKFMTGGREWGVNVYELTDNQFIVKGSAIDLKSGEIYSIAVSGTLQ